MDVHKHSERIERLEIVETGRRRRWSEEEKLKIVIESFQAPRQISATARRHGISRWQLHEWRRSFRAEQNKAAEQGAEFVPAIVTAEPKAGASELVGSTGAGTIEIDFVSGARMRVTGGKSHDVVPSLRSDEGLESSQ
jgi:transposase